MYIISEITDFPENVLLTGTKDISVTKYRLVTSPCRKKRVVIAHVQLSLRLEGSDWAAFLFTRLSGKQIESINFLVAIHSTDLYRLLP